MEELRKTTTKSPLPLYPVEDISQYARSVPQRYGNPGDMMVFVPINVKRIKLLEIFQMQNINYYIKRSIEKKLRKQKVLVNPN